MSIVKVKLTQGFMALVNADDYERIAPYKWCVLIRSSTLAHAMRKHQGYTVYMHHIIMGNPLKGWYIDHINGNGLDNRAENLRIVNSRDNALNSDRCRNSNIIESHGAKWRVRPYINGVRISLGSFNTYEEAKAIWREYKGE